MILQYMYIPQALGANIDFFNEMRTIFPPALLRNNKFNFQIRMHEFRITAYRREFFNVSEFLKQLGNVHFVLYFRRIWNEKIYIKGSYRRYGMGIVKQDTIKI